MIRALRYRVTHALRRLADRVDPTTRADIEALQAKVKARMDADIAVALECIRAERAAAEQCDPAPPTCCCCAPDLNPSPAHPYLCGFHTLAWAPRSSGWA